MTIIINVQKGLALAEFTPLNISGSKARYSLFKARCRHGKTPRALAAHGCTVSDTVVSFKKL